MRLWIVVQNMLCCAISAALTDQRYFVASLWNYIVDQFNENLKIFSGTEDGEIKKIILELSQNTLFIWNVYYQCFVLVVFCKQSVVMCASFFHLIM